ncbi:hypothetical protein IWW55_003034, partial [Coemansia sp. RSA 2706]
MLRHVYQAGILTVFNSASSQPLQLWNCSDSATQHIEFTTDDEIVGTVMRIE